MEKVREIMNNTNDKLLEMYQTMLKIRMVEEKLVELHPEQMMKTPLHLYIGQEAVATGVCAALENGDVVFSTHRSHGHYIAKGGDLNSFMAEMYCKIDGCSKGKGGSMHLIDTKVGHFGSSAIVGGTIPIAVGAALALSKQKKQNVSVSFFGDGAADEGVLYESLNFAALFKLPVIFTCENNQLSVNSRTSQRRAVDNLPEKAKSFGLKAEGIDGNDAVAIYDLTKEMVERARQGLGPSLIECDTFRHKGHIGVEDDIAPGMRTEEELEEWKRKCPIRRMEKYINRLDILTKHEMIGIRRTIQNQIEDAIEYGRRSLLPAGDELLKDVFA